MGIGYPRVIRLGTPWLLVAAPIHPLDLCCENSSCIKSVLIYTNPKDKPTADLASSRRNKTVTCVDSPQIKIIPPSLMSNGPHDHNFDNDVSLRRILN